MGLEVLGRRATPGRTVTPPIPLRLCFPCCWGSPRTIVYTAQRPSL